MAINKYTGAIVRKLSNLVSYSDVDGSIDSDYLVVQFDRNGGEVSVMASPSGKPLTKNDIASLFDNVTDVDDNVLTAFNGILALDESVNYEVPGLEDIGVMFMVPHVLVHSDKQLGTIMDVLDDSNIDHDNVDITIAPANGLEYSYPYNSLIDPRDIIDMYDYDNDEERADLVNTVQDIVDLVCPNEPSGGSIYLDMYELCF